MKYKHHSIVLLVLLISTLSVRAQRLTALGTFQALGNYANPAATGEGAFLSLTGLWEGQWATIAGHPDLEFLSGQINLGRGRFRPGFGVNFISEKIGKSREYNVSFDAAPTLQLANNMRISLGLRFGWSNLHRNWEEIKLEDPEDPKFIGYSSPRNALFGGFGFYFEKWRKGVDHERLIFLGVAIPNAIGYIYSEETEARIWGENNALFLVQGGGALAILNKYSLRPSGFIGWAPHLIGQRVLFQLNLAVKFHQYRTLAGIGYEHVGHLRAYAEVQPAAGYEVLFGASFGFALQPMMPHDGGSYFFYAKYIIGGRSMGAYDRGFHPTSK